MWLRSDHSQFTEVFVERENNLAGVVSTLQDRSIARVGGPIDNALNLVTGLSERSCNRPRHASVDQDLHAPGL